MKSCFFPLKTKSPISLGLIVIWILITLGILVFKGFIPGWADKGADFYNYYVGAELVVSKKAPVHQFYNNGWFKNQAQQMGVDHGAKFSPFPPITAYLYMPLTFFEPLVAKRIWLVFNLLLLIILPFRIQKIYHGSLTRALLILTLFVIPIASCLRLGQVYLFISFLLLELFGQGHMVNRPKWVGFITGLLASLKYLPIVFLGYLIHRNKLGTVLTMSFLGILIPSLVILAIDSSVYTVFFQHFTSHLQGHLPGQGKYAVAFQSVDSLLNRLFVFDTVNNPVPILDFPGLKPIIKYSLFGTLAGIMFNTLKKNKCKITPTLVSIGIIGIFTLIPASATYHYLLLLWPIIQLIKWLEASQPKKAIAIMVLLIFLTLGIQQHQIPNIDQLPMINLLIHYPRFWGMLCVFLLFNFYHNKSLKVRHG